MSSDSTKTQTFVFRDYRLGEALALGCPFYLSVLVMTIAAMFLISRGEGVSSALVGVACFCVGNLALNSFRQAHAVVGADGIGFPRAQPHGRPPFVPFSDVMRVDRVDPLLDLPAAVTIHTKNGQHRLARLRDAESFLTATNAALEAYRARPKFEIPVLPETTQYRVATLPRERLLQIAADPAAGPKVRVRAAELAAEDGAGAALGELAEATADPAVAQELTRLAKL